MEKATNGYLFMTTIFLTPLSTRFKQDQLFHAQLPTMPYLCNPHLPLWLSPAFPDTIFLCSEYTLIKAILTLMRKLLHSDSVSCFPVVEESTTVKTMPSLSLFLLLHHFQKNFGMISSDSAKSS